MPPLLFDSSINTKTKCGTKHKNQNRTKEELDAKRSADISAFPYDVHIKFESNLSFKKKKIMEEMFAKANGSAKLRLATCNPPHASSAEKLKIHQNCLS